MLHVPRKTRENQIVVTIKVLLSYLIYCIRHSCFASPVFYCIRYSSVASPSFIYLFFFFQIEFGVLDQYLKGGYANQDCITPRVALQALDVIMREFFTDQSLYV